jgi:hypothetical protein
LETAISGTQTVDDWGWLPAGRCDIAHEVEREGATKNAPVVSKLLIELAARGLDFSVPRLYLLDGGKALATAVRRNAGEAAFLQRCLRSR